MATVTGPMAPSAEPAELHNGDRMTRAEFHHVYSRMRRTVRAELIGGIVHMASPLKIGHGTHHNLLGTLFGIYTGHTPGVECGDNTTIILGDADEPQPDLYMRVLPEHGGQSRTTVDDFVDGAPEFIAEVALSSRAIDLFEKRDTYAQNGAFEYFILDLRDHRLHWFDLRTGKELAADTDDICRIRTFPGLWINGPALLEHNFKKLAATLDAGLETPEHTVFVQRLEQARQP